MRSFISVVSFRFAVLYASLYLFLFCIYISLSLFRPVHFSFMSLSRFSGLSIFVSISLYLSVQAFLSLCLSFSMPLCITFMSLLSLLYVFLASFFPWPTFSLTLSVLTLRGRSISLLRCYNSISCRSCSFSCRSDSIFRSI